MRIALLPLDSRPPSWQFPLRIAQIAGVELVHPPKEMLGALQQGAHQRALLDWLIEAAREADASVISWDALLYGGLVQSRSEDEPLDLRELADGLNRNDWARCAGYLWLTIPRLGMTIASEEQWSQHRLLAEYFTVWGQASAEPADDKTAARLRELEEQLGSDALSRAWWLRRRNLDNAREALQLAATLGFRTCHVAVEDNARSGPHLDELQELRRLSLELVVDSRRADPPREPPGFSFFDGADECGSLLTARAVLDQLKAAPVPVRLTLYPALPTPDKYFGLYESHSLEDGLHFLAKFLGLEFRSEGVAQWLVCFGKQPQPDVFVKNPKQVFSNSLLLPPRIEGHVPLFLADLQACNGGNPHLLRRVAELAGPRLKLASAWNTNFNALGFCAAALAVAALPDADPAQLQRLLAEHIADDYFYQSGFRSEVVAHCRHQALSPLDLAGDPHLPKLEREAVERIAPQTRELLSMLGQEKILADTFTVRFPWQRAFEIEVTWPSLQ